MIEGFGSGSGFIPLTSGPDPDGLKHVDPDPDSDPDSDPDPEH